MIFVSQRPSEPNSKELEAPHPIKIPLSPSLTYKYSSLNLLCTLKTQQVMAIENTAPGNSNVL